MKGICFVAGLGLLLPILALSAIGIVVGQAPEPYPPAQQALPPSAPPTAVPDRETPPIPITAPQSVSPGFVSEGQQAPAGESTERGLPGKEPGLGEAGAAQSNDNPTGRQEPSVSIEWIGPPTAKIGQAVTYQIVVKNVCSAAVQQVVVRNRVPVGAKVTATEPRAQMEGTLLMWNIGTLQPHQEKRIDLQLLPESRGDVSCQAWVTFTGSSIARLVVREPKLAIKTSAPERVLLGDAATVTLTVTNPGDGPADHVRIEATLSGGLEHTRGKTVEFDIGNLGPNESRSVQIVCGTKTGGEQKCEAVASADGNLTAKDQAVLDVVMPHIDLEAVGPKLRYLDRPATYTFKVSNPGTAPASNVTITDQIPQGFKFVAASDGGRHDFSTRTVSWFLGDLTPGQSREVRLEVVAVNTGEHRHKASAIGARGLKADNEVMTRVEGLSALLMEMVDVDDPVEVGADTTYEIRVTNTGSKMETNLQLICTFPDKMEFRGAHGVDGLRHRVEGRDVIFEPLPKLAPRADAIYRVNVRGVAPGDLRFRAKITADGLTDPVHKEESTKVYGDEGTSR